MNPFFWLRNLCSWAWEFCSNVALECYLSGWPIDFIGDGFLFLANFFAEASGYFYDASDWYYTVSFRLADILSASQIYTYFKAYFDAAVNAWSWVQAAVANVRAVIEDWWSATSSDVLGWIDAAKQWAGLRIDSLQDQLDELRVMVQDIPGALPDLSAILEWFTDWPGRVLEVITTWWAGHLLEIGDLIDGTIKTWFPFYDELAALWGEIREFFTDPEQWIYSRLDSFFERFW